MFDFFRFNLAIYDTDTVLTGFPEEGRLHLNSRHRLVPNEARQLHGGVFSRSANRTFVG